MYKIHCLLIILLLAVSAQRAYTQEFTNEYNLFLNSDESANAFRYNPAVLGLGHKFNANLNLFYYERTRGIRAIDFQGALGSIGVAYNSDSFRENYSDGFQSGTFRQNNKSYSIGLGLGNKNLSLGSVLTYTNSRYSSSGVLYSGDTVIGTFSVEGRSRITNIRLGMLGRVSPFISIGAAYEFNISRNNNFRLSSNEILAGIGVRPLENDRLTLYADFFYNAWRSFELRDIEYKVGGEFKVIDGLKVHGFGAEGFWGAGLSVNFGNLGLGSNYYTQEGDYYGSLYSLNYSVEKRENIIPKPERNLEVRLSGSLQDYYTSPVLFGLISGERKPYHNIIKHLDNASKDENINGLLLNIEPLSTGRFGISGSVEEIGNALQRFKSKGKRIVAYLSEGAGIEEYYLATYADKIVMPREAHLLYGLSIDVLNYRQFLKKLGVNLEVFSEGTYKLTYQGLIDSTTAEGEEVINRSLDLIYDRMLNRISEGRKVTVTEELRKELSSALNARELKTRNLIDELGWYEDAKDVLNSITRTERLTAPNESRLWSQYWGEPKEIAVIGIYGGITTGESKPPSLIQLPIPFFGGGRTTGSQTILRQLNDAFRNPNVKAIVLRVNSGGGSALGSAEIYDAVKRLKRKYNKPFIVSMGDAAASGGYYVSAYADKIFANNTTVTGSIGVFFAVPKLDSLADMLDIKAENYKRGENSDILSPYVEFDEEKKEIIRKQVRYIYDEFIGSVAEGRKMTKEEVDAVARGRVWLGSDAFAKKLTDNIGGLYEALKYARGVSGLVNDENVKVNYYPVAGSSFYEDFLYENIVNVIENKLFEFLGF